MPDDLDKLTEELDSLDDLESQLAALGVFGEDSEDSGDSDDNDDSFFPSGDDDDDPFAMLEALTQGGGKTPPPPPMPAPADSGELDLDRQLELLLNADRTADESFEMKEVAAATVVQSVYDPEVDGMGFVQYEKGIFDPNKESEQRPKLFENMPVWKMAIVAVFGILFIIAGAATAVFATLDLREQREARDAVAHYRPIEMPVDVANNANAIFVNQTASFMPESAGPLANQTFTLSRISAGYSGTFFFFEENFNPEDYIFLLFNQARRLYTRTRFDIRPAPGEGTVLKFESLSQNTLFLTLSIQCRETHEQTGFNYRFLSSPVVAAPVYVSRPVHVMAEEDPSMTGLVVRYAVFDNASSQIHYSFAPSPQRAGLRLAPGSDAPLVALNDTFTTIVSLTNEKSSVYFDEFGVTMGSATFGPVFSLDERAMVIFNGLTYYHPNPVVDIEPRDLFGRDQNEPHPVQVGPFTLNFEAMAQQGLRVILVFHGLDQNNRRVETAMHVYLRVNVGGGFIDLPGEVRSSPRGTDVVFDLEPYVRELRDVPISQYSLIIRSVEFDVPQVSVPLQLSQRFGTASLRRASAERAVEQAFMSLLAYKSGEISRDGFIGLSPEMMRSPLLMETFAARHDINERPMYGSTVTTGDLINNYYYLSVVEVQWVTGEGENIEYFSAMYQVTARSTDLIWSVIDVVQL